MLKQLRQGLVMQIPDHIRKFLHIGYACYVSFVIGTVFHGSIVNVVEFVFEKKAGRGSLPDIALGYLPTLRRRLGFTRIGLPHLTGFPTTAITYDRPSHYRVLD